MPSYLALRPCSGVLYVRCAELLCRLLGDACDVIRKGDTTPPWPVHHISLRQFPEEESAIPRCQWYWTITQQGPRL